MKEKLLKKVKNMAKNRVFANSLIINQLGKTTKIVQKSFGSFTIISYLYIYQTTKRYGLPS